MEIKIVKEQENPLFSRKEVHVSVEDMITPSLLEARKIVAEQLKSDEALVRVRKIDTRFGSRVFTIIADIYDSVEEFNRVVKKTKQEVEAEKKAIADAKAAEAEAEKAEEEAKAAAEEAKAAEAEAKKAKEEAPKEEAEAPKEEAEVVGEKTE